MQINYLGHACFKVKTKKTVLVTDPFSSEIGFSLPKTRADIVTISHEHSDHNCLDRVEGQPFVIRAPGEYEVANVSIFGFSSFHDRVQGAKRGKNTVYTIKMGGISLCHLGDLGDKLDDEQVEEANGVDILFVPVGGVYTLGPKGAVAVINQIEPKIVIPMHYKTRDLKRDTFAELASLADFLQEVDKQDAPREEKLIISKTSLPEERKIVPMVRK